MTERLSPEARLAAHHARAAAQTGRERSLAAAMRADLSREADRQSAELKIREGVSVNLADLAVPPTEEWERQGEAVNYTVKTEGQNVQVVTTRRRVRIGQVMKAHRMGKITDDQFLACEWYQEQYERTGLEGRLRSVDLSTEVYGGPNYGIIFAELQMKAQTQYRAARSAIPARFLKFFELVVLDNLPVDRARRIAPSGRNPWARLRASAEAVFTQLEAMDPDWKRNGLTDVC
ncbi:hypothetical protein [Novosphingobium sp.]|uniref:hypothetical protein n=1 Tax=Novosphingobium sp. TaxID=1874826 RepID=UPI00286E3700|nr:hypothetical protein [Novosphingobium sp.]